MRPADRTESGVMTGPGTNSYIVGTEALALIDPGPEIESHIEALLRLVGTKLRWCTHMHHDHSPAAHAIHAATHAQLIGMPPQSFATRYALCAAASCRTASASKGRIHVDGDTRRGMLPITSVICWRRSFFSPATT